MDAENTRRRFLELAGVGSGLLLAGCSGDGGSGSTRTDETQSDAPQTTSTTTETQTQTETEADSRTETATPTQMSTVFHFSESGESNQRHALANVANLLATDMVEMDNTVLVANGKGIYLLTQGKAAFPDKVASLTEKGASFRACSNSMDALDVAEDDLLDGVEVVPAGVGELTRLQVEEGYAYIETP